MSQPNDSSQEHEFEVERIIGYNDDTGMYLIKWAGYDEKTWEPRENLTNCQDMLKKYELKCFVDKYLYLEACESDDDEEEDDEEEEEEEDEDEAEREEANEPAQAEQEWW